MKNQLIFPMAFYVFYIGSLAVYLFRTRLRAVKTGEVPIKYFRAYTGESLSDRMILVGRHYDHQFQLPMLFFATGIAEISLGMANEFTLILMWLFVISRLLHSWVHLGSNLVHQRAAIFGTGWILILILWAQLVYFAL